MNSSTLGLNPYDSSPQAEAAARPVMLEERVPWLDIFEGTFYGFGMSPFVGALGALMLYIQTKSDGYREFIDFYDMTPFTSPTASLVGWRLLGGGVIAGTIAGILLGFFAGLLIALQPKLSHRGLMWQMVLPAVVVVALIAEYIMLMGWWPFVGTNISGHAHLMLAAGPSAVLLIAGLGGLSSYKLAGRPQYFDAESATHGIEARLVLASWLRRKWKVSLPHGEYLVDYRPMSFWERVYVNERVVCQQWSVTAVVVPRFDFSLGSQSATIEIRSWPWLTVRWLTLKVDGQVLYGEGTPS